jgi:coenzyme F420 biosynthesis associated uncharacterized protein
MSGMVDWGVAEKVARRLADRTNGPRDTFPGLDDEMARHTALAAELVTDETGLLPPGEATGQVVGRADWASANIASFRTLTAPLVHRLEEKAADKRNGRPPPAALAKAGGAVAGAEVGALLGWMSGRVLGQYDLLVAPEDVGDAPADRVYYVGPNMVGLERRFGFPPSEFRLWVALHECTHRAQFTGVPWLRAHYLGLVHELLSSVDPDPKRFVAALRDGGDVRARLKDGGIAHVFATPEQREILGRIGGMMSLLEGHGDVVMNRAGVHHVPSAPRFARVLSARRQQANPLQRFMQRLVGLEAKLDQYESGERFIAAIEAAEGEHVIERAWERPEHLPSMEEIRSPDRWLARVVPARA